MRNYKLDILTTLVLGLIWISCHCECLKFTVGRENIKVVLFFNQYYPDTELITCFALIKLHWYTRFNNFVYVNTDACEYSCERISGKFICYFFYLNQLYWIKNEAEAETEF